MEGPFSRVRCEMEVLVPDNIYFPSQFVEETAREHFTSLGCEVPVWWSGVIARTNVRTPKEET